MAYQHRSAAQPGHAATVVLLVATVAAAAAFIASLVRSRTAPAPAGSAIAAPTIGPGEPVRGTSGPLAVVFGDYECPACAAFGQVLAQLRAEGVLFREVWKDFPLLQHASAIPAAVAAGCADQQGKFWQYHDQLLANQDQLQSSLYSQLAQSLGLNADQFAQCTAAPATVQAQIQVDMAEAQQLGVDATPYLFIGGQRYPSPPSLAQFKQLIQTTP